MGPGTQFLKQEAQSDIFRQATGESLNWKTMRDREFVNRFCAFQLLGLDKYRGDMDQFLADCLRTMNRMSEAELQDISEDFRRGLENNWLLFGRHAFRKHEPGQQKRWGLNVSLWDVMSTGLSRYETHCVRSSADSVRKAIYDLLEDEDFNTSITYGTNQANRVHKRFEMAMRALQEALGDYPN